MRNVKKSTQKKNKQLQQKKQRHTYRSERQQPTENEMTETHPKRHSKAEWEME